MNSLHLPDFTNLETPGEVEQILVVDDEPLIREPVAQYLSAMGYLCQSAASGEEALRILQEHPISLVISDIRMPGLSGLQLLEHVTRNHPNVAIIMMTAVSDLQTAVQSMKQGAYDYITKPFNLDQVCEAVKTALEQRQFRLEDQKIAENLQQMVRQNTFALDSALKDLEQHRDMTLEALVRALDAREHETSCHSLRVQCYAVRLAHEFGIEGDALVELARGALLHDIGKIGISDTILLKPGRLTEAEWVEMRKHPVIGYQILCGVKFLGDAALMVQAHHERYDGKGYPQGLQGEQIPLAARIFAIIDTYDAMTSDRPYRKARPVEEAREEIRRQSGTQFDPAVVERFLRIPQEDWDEIRRQYN